MRQVIPGLALAAACSGAGTGQRTFPSPDSAVQAVFTALATNDTTALLAIMGPDSRALVIPADAVQGTRERQVVVAAMMERWTLEGEGNTRTIVIGNEGWPMPVPLIEENGTWRFNTEEGLDEAFFRRVGRNELVIMDVLHAFVDAQKEYASQGRDGMPKGAYAQRILSDSGKHNGLHWRTSAGDRAMSPMGELVAFAAAEGYSDRKAPYHGYFLKVLTSQGPNAPGGARSWVTNGQMRGGYALLAWPAEYGASGVMTFLIGPDDVLRQKDLGDSTATLAAAIEAFDPDSSWTTP